MAAETEQTSSLTKQAQTLIEAEDYEAAIPLLREAVKYYLLSAEQGFPVAMFAAITKIT